MNNNCIISAFEETRKLILSNDMTVVRAKRIIKDFETSQKKKAVVSNAQIDALVNTLNSISDEHFGKENIKSTT